MRLFLLPISTRRSLLYCQRLNHHLTSQKTLIDKVTEKASATWHQWENSEKKYQKSITEYGNKVFQRIPFEEWGLKTIPPLSTRRKQAELTGADRVEVVFPARYINPEKVGDILWKLGTDRQALHRRRMWWSIVGMPISAPVALIPVIPNIPFFYLVFRAWSHWRALSGSKHIEFILENKLLKSAPSSALDSLYPPDRPNEKEREAERTGDETEDNFEALKDKEEEVMLLKKHSGEAIAKSLEIPELRGELERAIQQVEGSIKAQKELMEEKRRMDGATKTGPENKGTKTDEKR